MKHINFQTAKKLNEAGYQPPIFQFGQIWYFDGIEVMLHSGSKNKVNFAYENTTLLYSDSPKEIESIFYAPDATEILHRIQMEFSTHSVKLEYRAPWGKYAATFDNPNSELNWTFYDTNPHEVMARLYIQIKESVNTEDEE